MSEPKYYPENPCYLAPLKPEAIPDNCDCGICQNRKAFLKAASASRTVVAYVCPVCLTQDEGYYGKLVFESDDLPLYCPNHRAKVELRRA